MTESQSCHNQSKDLFATLAFWQKTAFSRCWSVTFHLIAISWVNICGTKWRNLPSSSEMNGPKCFIAFGSRPVVNIYWDECIKACPIWWEAPSFPPDRIRKLQLNITSFHSTCIFIKWRYEATSEVLISAFLEWKEKNRPTNCFSLAYKRAWSFLIEPWVTTVAFD